MYKKLILICGMPRSGTSWLGQIMDSSARVAFRMEPLFSYRFKNTISNNSSKADIVRFFEEVYLSSDDFISQKINRDKGIYLSFDKNPALDFLVVKTTRHHNLLERYLDLVDRINVVSIIRHPCAAINSWMKTDREFKSKGCKVDTDWRSGRCRKDGEGEFWGFNDWLSVTRLHVQLSQKYENFSIVKYSDLIRKPEETTRGLFKSLFIPFEKQTEDFLKACHSRHDNDPYSVFKGPEVENKWMDELDSTIAKEIIRDTINSGLSGFIND